ncbi:hypothetical protein [Anaerobiospirillum sp. NML120449]|uniref:hypothetical protein n=1 Tax=Anaerobiospirillum sp. NML120449 TaxID=2932817 RepID=UPI001FF5CE82|nr:hypothetical protein [Anaerobiospirillum sp. NML120449]MCK0525938.1 hypothetical protein [Anaerobiospirillum sp. NML120449]
MGSQLPTCPLTSKARAVCYRHAGHHQKHGQPVTVVPGTIKSTGSLLPSCQAPAKSQAAFAKAGTFKIQYARLHHV